MTGHWICPACGIAILDQLCHECGGQGRFVAGLAVSYHAGQPAPEPRIKAANVPPFIAARMRLQPRKSIVEREHEAFKQFLSNFRP